VSLVWGRPEPDAEDSEDAIRRGKQAELLLQNDLLREAIADMEEKAVWVMTDGETVETREQARNIIRGLRGVVQHLRVIVEDGSVAASAIEASRRTSAT
jgi:hypothetical protein